MAAKVSRAKRGLSGRLSASISELLNVHRKSLVNVADDESMASLHQAALMGNGQVVRSLVEGGANINLKDGKGNTPLHFASTNNATQICSYLLKHGATLDAVNQDGDSALHIACQRGHADVVSLLLYYRADPSRRNLSARTPLDLSSEYGRAKIVQILLDSGLCRSSLLNPTQNHLISPLHCASRNGHISTMRLLIEYGADVNQCAVHGAPLHDAVTYGKLEGVALLLQCGADPLSVAPGSALTPVDLARKRSKSPVAKEIIIMLQEASQAVYARAIQDHVAGDDRELNFVFGDIIQVLDRSSDFQWKGVLFGPKYSSRAGTFPASTVQLIDKKVAMQRSASQRQVKKVPVPQVPHLILAQQSATNPALSGSVGKLDTRCSTSSYGSIGPDDTFPTPPANDSHDTKLSRSQIPYSPRHINGMSTFAFNCRTCSPDIQAACLGSPRHRNSTGSNSSQGSSGFESMKSNSNQFVNVHVQSLRGDSPPNQRNSFHSSGSSSLGSMERLDESGYSSQVNVPELVLNGVADADVIRAWLHDLGYDEYIPLFLDAGYDLATIARMTPQDLTAVGVTKPGHRKRLTTEIHRLNVADRLPDVCAATVGEWLTAIHLMEYHDLFAGQGYNTMDSVLQLTWEDLEDIGVKKLGHLKKLFLAIRKLKEGRQARSVTSDPNANLAGEVLVINLPQQGQKLAAEVRPYNHVQDSATAATTSSPLRTFHHSPRALPCFSGSQERLFYQPEVLEITVCDSPSARGVSSPRLARLSSSGPYSNGIDHCDNDHHSAPTHFDFAPPGRYAGQVQVHEAMVHGSPASQRPKVTVKPRPVAKIVAKTKRNSREIPQDIIYLEQTDHEIDRIKHAHVAHATGNYANVAVTSNGLERLNGCNGYDACNSNSAIGCYTDDNNLSPRRLANAMSPVRSLSFKGTPPPPPPKRVAGLRKEHASQNGGTFQLSAHANLDDSFELSPAASIEEFPPPPFPITCEKSISALRSLRDQAPLVDSPLPPNYEPRSSNGCSSGTLERKCSQPLSIQNKERVDAVTADDSGGSVEALPFANENVGTIKQKSPRVTEDQHNGILHMTRSSPRKSVYEVFTPTTHGSCTSSQPVHAVAANGRDSEAVFDEIGSMLQGLTDQLDQLLMSR